MQPSQFVYNKKLVKLQCNADKTRVYAHIDDVCNVLVLKRKRILIREHLLDVARYVYKEEYIEIQHFADHLRILLRDGKFASKHAKPFIKTMLEQECQFPDASPQLERRTRRKRLRTGK